MEIKINKVKKEEANTKTESEIHVIAPEATPDANNQEPESFIKKKEESKPKLFANKKANIGLFICAGVVILMLFAALIIRFAF